MTLICCGLAICYVLGTYFQKYNSEFQFANSQVANTYFRCFISVYSVKLYYQVYYTHNKIVLLIQNCESCITWSRATCNYKHKHA